MSVQQLCRQCGAALQPSAQFCSSCGTSRPNEAPLAAMPGSQPELQRSDPYVYIPAPVQRIIPGVVQKPGKVQAIAIMCLVDGILNILLGIGLILTLCAAPLGIYALILGVMEIVYSAKVLPDPIKTNRPNKTLAIMQIVNVITGDVISLIVGILTLVFYSEPTIQEYFEAVPAVQSA